ncbi:hypothetical protein OH491_18180 [Termitidicoccus mucosus]|uniref:Uncharacterized protein n=1 Tax=Termitidicoccus mucosus TaxID=1184151 RepID=A0A178IIL7_9BACT|nr:hypothetical protein AW736_10425 [Opitutaceae bacterium TSB47]
MHFNAHQAGLILSWLRRFGAVCLLTAGAHAIGAPTGLPAVPIKHYAFPGPDRPAQMWSGLYAASNGRIYIGLCTHGDAATLYEFDPATEKMRLLANLTELAGERGQGTWTTGKIHVQMQELDGWIYFGTLCEDNGPPVIDFSSFRGLHWYRVEMATGRVEQLGMITRYWGLLGQDMDKARRLIYGLGEDGRLYRYHIKDDYTEELGRVDDWDICRTIFTDDQGNVYGSYSGGHVWKLEASSDRILDLELRLPVTRQSRTMANPMNDRRAQWRIVEWDPIDRAAYGIVGGSNQLFRYDVHAGTEGRFAMLAEMCAPPFREGDPFKIPSATLAMALSRKERKIYYIPVMEGDFDYGAVKLDLALPDGLSGGEMPPVSWMVTYDLKTGERRDLGVLRADDGRLAYGQGGAKADASGRIWFVGAFAEPDENKAARPGVGRFPYSMGLGCYDPAR